MSPRRVVIDTNVVLDLWVFADTASAALLAAIQSKQCAWIATAPMRDELARVLHYPQLQARMQYHGVPAEAVLQAFDEHSTCMPVAAKCAFTCKDADDQKFIDLAAAYAADLVSKDHAVLCMARRLQRCQVRVQRVWSADAPPPAAPNPPPSS